MVEFQIKTKYIRINYGSIDVLSYDDNSESIMRLDSIDIAYELMEIYRVDKKDIAIQQKLF